MYLVYIMAVNIFSSSQHWWGWGAFGTLDSLWMGVQNGTTLECSLAVPVEKQNKTNIFLLCDPAASLLDIYLGDMKAYVCKNNLCTNFLYKLYS